MNSGSDQELPHPNAVENSPVKSGLVQDGLNGVPGTRITEAPGSGILSQVHSVEFTAYSGPIPPPDLLQRFDEVYPGAARQILEDFVQESAHRRSMERKIVGSESFKEVFGAVAAGLIGLTGVGGGLWLAHEGRATGGLSTIFATLASLVGVFLFQARKTDPEPSPGTNRSQGKGDAP